jgi:hypothetical protein
LYAASSAAAVFVQGEQRIGFYARQDIPEQCELFFDYDYKRTRDNDFILQTPAVNVKWMKSRKQTTTNNDGGVDSNDRDFAKVTKKK